MLSCTNGMILQSSVLIQVNIFQIAALQAFWWLSLGCVPYFHVVNVISQCLAVSPSHCHNIITSRGSDTRYDLTLILPNLICNSLLAVMNRYHSVWQVHLSHQVCSISFRITLQGMSIATPCSDDPRENCFDGASILWIWYSYVCKFHWITDVIHENKTSTAGNEFVSTLVCIFTVLMQTSLFSLGLWWFAGDCIHPSRSAYTMLTWSWLWAIRSYVQLAW